MHPKSAKTLSAGALGFSPARALGFSLAIAIGSLPLAIDLAPAAVSAPILKAPASSQGSGKAADSGKKTSSGEPVQATESGKAEGSEDGKAKKPYVESGQKKHFDYKTFAIEIPKESRIKHKSVKDFNLYRVYRGSKKVRLLVYAGDYPKFPLLKITPDIQMKRTNSAKKDQIIYTQKGQVVGSETLFKVPSRGTQAVDTKNCVVVYVHAVIPIGTPEDAAWTTKIVNSIKPHDGFEDDETRMAELAKKSREAAHK